MKNPIRLPWWFSKAIFESVLIVFSILAALAVAEYQEDRELKRLVSNSLSSFRYEIDQNKNRIDDLYPFHVGLQSVLKDLEQKEGSRSIEEFRNILEGFHSAVLLTTAWDTALATGALSRMDYGTVSALSLTYSIQNRFQELQSTGLKELRTFTRLQNENTPALTYAARQYLSDITSAEEELQVVYQQALQLIDGGENDANSPKL